MAYPHLDGQWTLRGDDSVTCEIRNSRFDSFTVTNEQAERRTATWRDGNAFYVENGRNGRRRGQYGFYFPTRRVIVFANGDWWRRRRA